MHSNSWLIFERYGKPYIKEGSRILELGPGADPSLYRSNTSVEVACWDTLDFPGRTPVTHELQEPYSFPIPDDSYDVVISGQVIEHVPKIWRWMREITRVTRPGGTVITIAPISWPYHEDPFDCWRIYPAGLCALYEESGLDVAVATWESIELEPLLRRLPGPLRKRMIWQSLSGLILLGHHGLRTPWNGAYDTVVVGHKPSEAGVTRSGGVRAASVLADSEPR
jgi:SAM-dependent methyltransferase